MKLDAFVFKKDGEFCVLFTSDGEAFDYADGFEDELEAALAARRGVYGNGTVNLDARPWEVL